MNAGLNPEVFCLQTPDSKLPANLYIRTDSLFVTDGTGKKAAQTHL